MGTPQTDTSEARPIRTPPPSRVNPIRGAKRYMRSANIEAPNYARGSVMALLANCIAFEKLRGRPDKVDLPRNSTHGDVLFKTIQMNFLEGMGSNPDEGKRGNLTLPKPLAYW